MDRRIMATVVCEFSSNFQIQKGKLMIYKCDTEPEDTNFLVWPNKWIYQLKVMRIIGLINSIHPIRSGLLYCFAIFCTNTVPYRNKTNKLLGNSIYCAPSCSIWENSTAQKTWVFLWLTCQQSKRHINIEFRSVDKSTLLTLNFLFFSPCNPLLLTHSPFLSAT